jgi:hypothetical protein
MKGYVYGRYVEFKKKMRGNWHIPCHLVDDDKDDDDDALNHFITRLVWTFQTAKLHVILGWFGFILRIKFY